MRAQETAIIIKGESVTSDDGIKRKEEQKRQNIEFYAKKMSRLKIKTSSSRPCAIAISSIFFYCHVCV